mmetsp:Transcript_7342/g.17680  ORF Transcript_7342/g.17680 Transcript_7342/m.17680 type:complete len:210 (-) Transcript_7342:351-980(-)
MHRRDALILRRAPPPRRPVPGPFAAAGDAAARGAPSELQPPSSGVHGAASDARQQEARSALPGRTRQPPCNGPRPPPRMAPAAPSIKRSCHRIVQAARPPGSRDALPIAQHRAHPLVRPRPRRRPHPDVARRVEAHPAGSAERGHQVNSPRNGRTRRADAPAFQAVFRRGDEQCAVIQGRGSPLQDQHGAWRAHFRVPRPHRGVHRGSR